MIPTSYTQISECNPNIKKFVAVLKFTLLLLFVIFKAMHSKPYT